MSNSHPCGESRSRAKCMVGLNFLHVENQLSSGFLNLGTNDILDWIMLSCQDAVLSIV